MDPLTYGVVLVEGASAFDEIASDLARAVISRGMIDPTLCVRTCAEVGRARFDSLLCYPFQSGEQRTESRKSGGVLQALKIR